MTLTATKLIQSSTEVPYTPPSEGASTRMVLERVNNAIREQAELEARELPSLEAEATELEASTASLRRGSKPWTSEDVRALRGEIAYFRAIQDDDVYRDWLQRLAAKLISIQSRIRKVKEDRLIAPDRVASANLLLGEAEEAVLRDQTERRLISLRKTIAKQRAKGQRGSQPSRASKVGSKHSLDAATILSRLSPQEFAAAKENGVDLVTLMRTLAGK